VKAKWIRKMTCLMARYNTGDFSAPHRRIRILPESRLAPTGFE
jgi:hypothetical protein